MRQFNRVLSILMVLILCMGTMIPAFAGQKTVILLSESTEEIEKGYKSHSDPFDFYVPATGKCEILFDGLYSYGNAFLYIWNQKGDMVFEKEFEIDADENDCKLSVRLKQGEYTLQLYNASKYGVCWYSFTVFATYSSPVESIKLNKNALELSVGKSTNLKATCNPSFPASWSSSNKKVAIVDSKGNVTAKALGVAKIKAKADTKAATCTVKVTKKTLQMLLNESKSFKGYIKNTKNYEKATWSTSNKKIVAVSKSGKVTTNSYGSANIIAKIGNSKYTIRVNVVPPISVTTLKFGVVPNVDYFEQKAKLELDWDVRAYHVSNEGLLISLQNNTKKKIKYIYMDLEFRNQYDDLLRRHSKVQSFSSAGIAPQKEKTFGSTELGDVLDYIYSVTVRKTRVVYLDNSEDSFILNYTSHNRCEL